MTATWLDLKHPLDPGLDRLLRDLDDSLKERSVLGSDEREAETALMLDAFEQGLLA